MIAAIADCEIMEEESYSDHNIINYNLNFNLDKAHKYNYQGPRFIIKEHQHVEFNKNFCQRIEEKLQIPNGGRNITETNERLAERLKSQEDVGKFTERIDETLSTCTEMFKYQTSPKYYTKGKSVPWWMTTLMIMRKRTNVLRRRYQRTLNNKELRAIRKNMHIKEKKMCQAVIKKEKNELLETTLHHYDTKQLPYNSLLTL
jgi:dTDP-4-amino-4,6-dideoxygalactose transaminase